MPQAATDALDHPLWRYALRRDLLTARDRHGADIPWLLACAYARAHRHQPPTQNRHWSRLLVRLREQRRLAPPASRWQKLMGRLELQAERRYLTLLWLEMAGQESCASEPVATAPPGLGQETWLQLCSMGEK